jgi:hypothetical protein
MTQEPHAITAGLVDRCARLEMALATALKYMPRGPRYAGPRALDVEAVADLRRVFSVMEPGRAAMVQDAIEAAMARRNAA